MNQSTPSRPARRRPEIAIYALVGVLLAFSGAIDAQSAAKTKSDRPSSESTVDKRPADQTPSRGKSSSLGPVPWALNRTYSYAWVLRGSYVGDTEFVIRLPEEKTKTADKKATSNAKKKHKSDYHIQSHLKFHNDHVNRSMKREYVFNDNWVIQKIDSSDNLEYTNTRRSKKTEKIWKEGTTLLSELTLNGSPPTRSEILLPSGTHVLPADGVVTWGILMPLELPIDTSKNVRVAYPGMGIVYEVKIRNRGSDKIKLRWGEEVETVRYAFQSKNRQLAGDVWVDKQLRVVRYRQDKLVIDLKL